MDHSHYFSGSVLADKCSYGGHNVWTVWPLFKKCQRCRGQGSYNYSGTVFKKIPYKGIKTKRVKKPYFGIVSYHIEKNYSKIVEFSQDYPYSGPHDVTCQEHHICSYSDLSAIVLAISALCTDIVHYHNIMDLQKEYFYEFFCKCI